MDNIMRTGLRISCPTVSMDVAFGDVPDGEMQLWLDERLIKWRWGFGEDAGVDLVFTWVLDEASLRDFEVEFKLRWL